MGTESGDETGDWENGTLNKAWRGAGADGTEAGVATGDDDDDGQLWVQNCQGNHGNERAVKEVSTNNIIAWPQSLSRAQMGARGRVGQGVDKRTKQKQRWMEEEDKLKEEEEEEERMGLELWALLLPLSTEISQ